MKLKAFDWDKGNLDKNLVKHKVDFREAEEIFLTNQLNIILIRNIHKKRKDI